MMKSVLATLILAIVCTTGIFAQKGQGKQVRNGEKPTPEERATRMTEKMTKKLELNDYQSDQMASLNLNLAQNVLEIKNSDLEREEKRESIKSLRDNYNSKVAGILSPEQNTKFLQWQENRKGKRGGKGQRGGGKGNCPSKGERPNRN